MNEHFLSQALYYDLLASYYKYLNPSKHIEYYKKHIQAVNQYVSKFHNHPSNSPNRLNPKMIKFRFLNASFDSSSFDIYLNGRLTLTNISFKEISPYLQIPAGHYRFDIFKAGKRNFPVLSYIIFFTPGFHYTIGCTGPSAKLHLIAYMEAPKVNRKEAKIKFVHLSPDAPSFDVFLHGVGNLFHDVPYLMSTSYKSIDPGKYDIKLNISNTTDTLLKKSKIEFLSGCAYTIFAIGLTNGTPSLEIIYTKG